MSNPKDPQCVGYSIEVHDLNYQFQKDLPRMKPLTPTFTHHLGQAKAALTRFTKANKAALETRPMPIIVTIFEIKRANDQPNEEITQISTWSSKPIPNYTCANPGATSCADTLREIQKE